MFDFEKLDVYQAVKEQNIKVFRLLQTDNSIDEYVREQWKKVSLESVLNLVEGTGRLNNNDKKQFLILSRSSIFEAASILEMLHGMMIIDDDTHHEMYEGYEKCSKMLLGMYRSYNEQDQRRRETKTDVQL